MSAESGPCHARPRSASHFRIEAMAAIDDATSSQHRSDWGGSRLSRTAHVFVPNSTHRIDLAGYGCALLNGICPRARLRTNGVGGHAVSGARWDCAARAGTALSGKSFRCHLEEPMGYVSTGGVFEQGALSSQDSVTVIDRTHAARRARRSTIALRWVAVTASLLVPAVGAATDATAVSAGERHTCAVTSDGAMRCWGWNPFGGLGDGTTTDRLTPVTVVGLEGTVVAEATGALSLLRGDERRRRAVLGRESIRATRRRDDDAAPGAGDGHRVGKRRRRSGRGLLPHVRPHQCRRCAVLGRQLHWPIGRRDDDAATDARCR